MYCRILLDLAALLRELAGSRRSVPLMEELCLLLDRACGAKVDYADPRAKQRRLDLYFAKTERPSGRKREVSLDRLIDDLEQKGSHMACLLRAQEWLPQGFFNGYYDNDGRRAEGNVGGRLRMTLPPQVFAIMSGVASDAQVRSIWSSLNRYLRDSRHKGYRLNTDFGGIQMRLGRAFGFSYGDKENGAFFSHMCVMLANALYSRGFAKEGASVLESIRGMAMAERAGIPPVLPEYFNSEGKGLYMYLTGSASWYVHTLVRETLGLKFRSGDLLIEPGLLASDLPRGSLQARLLLKGKVLTVRYSVPRSAPSGRKLRVKEVLQGGRKILPENGSYLLKTGSLSRGVNSVRVILE
jgi:cellobiose phosphorylase